MSDRGLSSLVLVKARSSGGKVRQSLWMTNRVEARVVPGAESCTFRPSEHQSSKWLDASGGVTIPAGVTVFKETPVPFLQPSD